MRLIDADALLRHSVEADSMGAMLVVGIGHIFSAPTVSPWVKISDRLPDDDEPVLVTYVGHMDNLPYSDAIAVYAHGEADNYAGAWYWQDSDGVDDNPVKVSITHWMPIPPLPEEQVQHLRALHGNVFNAKNQFFGNVENLFDS